MTNSEILQTLSDAINFIDRSGKPDADGIAERLLETIAEIKSRYNIED